MCIRDRLNADKTVGKSPLSVQFKASNSFDRNELGLNFTWTFGTLGSSNQSDTTFTFYEAGEYMVYLKVENTDGFITEDSVAVKVLPNGTPYGGTPISVPGTIQAENYDNGGEGIAYHDMDANNQFYRTGEGVD